MKTERSRLHRAKQYIFEKRGLLVFISGIISLLMVFVLISMATQKISSAPATGEKTKENMQETAESLMEHVLTIDKKVSTVQGIELVGAYMVSSVAPPYEKPIAGGDFNKEYQLWARDMERNTLQYVDTFPVGPCSGVEWDVKNDMVEVNGWTSPCEAGENTSYAQYDSKTLRKKISIQNSFFDGKVTVFASPGGRYSLVGEYNDACAQHPTADPDLWKQMPFVKLKGINITDETSRILVDKEWTKKHPTIEIPPHEIRVRCVGQYGGGLKNPNIEAQWVNGVVELTVEDFEAKNYRRKIAELRLVKSGEYRLEWMNE